MLANSHYNIEFLRMVEGICKKNGLPVGQPVLRDCLFQIVSQHADHAGQNGTCFADQVFLEREAAQAFVVTALFGQQGKCVGTAPCRLRSNTAKPSSSSKARMALLTLEWDTNRFLAACVMVPTRFTSRIYCNCCMVTRLPNCRFCVIIITGFHPGNKAVGRGFPVEEGRKVRRGRRTLGHMQNTQVQKRNMP